ncbi:hypothetical protein HII31_08599, partial [Pseudocercospora fuligena]
RPRQVYRLLRLGYQQCPFISHLVPGASGSRSNRVYGVQIAQAILRSVSANVRLLSRLVLQRYHSATRGIEIFGSSCDGIALARIDAMEPLSMLVANVHGRHIMTDLLLQPALLTLCLQSFSSSCTCSIIQVSRMPPRKSHALHKGGFSTEANYARTSAGCRASGGCNSTAKSSDNTFAARLPSSFSSTSAYSIENPLSQFEPGKLDTTDIASHLDPASNPSLAFRASALALARSCVLELSDQAFGTASGLYAQAARAGFALRTANLQQRAILELCTQRRSDASSAYVLEVRLTAERNEFTGCESLVRLPLVAVLAVLSRSAWQYSANCFKQA